MHLFHTSPVHVARFDRLRDRIAPGLALTHHVCGDWLERARAGGVTTGLAAEVRAAIHAAPGTSLCSCTTLGPVAEAAGAVRIDRPLMQAAAAIGGRICLAYCLESTAAASMALLGECIAEAAIPAVPEALCLSDAWPHFEAGDTEAFAEAISAAIRVYVHERPDTDCVILAQASMEDAAPRLADLGLPVLTSPESAFRAALDADIVRR